MMSSVFQLNSIGTARMKGKILVTTQFDDMNEQYNCSLLVLQNFTTARKSSTMEAIYCDRYLYEGGGQWRIYHGAMESSHAWALKSIVKS